jgi:hypothetical protein
MGRSPKPRIEYGAEVLTLQRVLRTVSLDQSRSAEWRVRLIEHLTQAIQLLHADQARIAGGG